MSDNMRHRKILYDNNNNHNMEVNYELGDNH